MKERNGREGGGGVKERAVSENEGNGERTNIVEIT